MECHVRVLLLILVNLFDLQNGRLKATRVHSKILGKPPFGNVLTNLVWAKKVMNLPDTFLVVTVWKFNIAPEKWWLEDYIPIGMVHFQGLCQSSGGGGYFGFQI